MNMLQRLVAGVALAIVCAGSASAADDGATGAADPMAAMLNRLGERLGSNDRAESLLFFTPEERRVAFGHIDRLLPTRIVESGTDPYPLTERPRDFSRLTYELDGRTHGLDDFLAMPGAIGLLVVKDGAILFEHYAPGNDRDSRWISFSVTKSVTSLLIGAAIADGFIESVDEPVSHYLPRLRGTPYETATIRNVLNMASGVSWNEDYADSESDVARAGGANGLDLVQYLAALPRNAEPGKAFNYNTGETNLAGEILRSAIGNNAATYLTHRIWQPFGMESDATWLTSGAGGGETGGCCISATLRDFARIGIFAMHDGVLRDGTRVLPEGWMNESVRPSAGSEGYGYLWWLSGDGSFAAQGIFGQQIYIDPSRRLVIAAHGNAPTAAGSDYARHLRAVTQAFRAALP